MNDDKHPLIPTATPLVRPALERALRHAIDRKTKPLGALGRIEDLACQIGLVQGTLKPVLLAPQLVVFAADHGLARHGVSAYPSEVTAQMVQNICAGGAAVSVLARQHGLALTVVDAGVDAALAAHPLLLDRKIARGSADALEQAAMTIAQCEQALRAGRELVRALPGNVLIPGEMGIGNSSAAALLLARIGDLPIEHCTGRGTGLDDAALARKTALLARVLQRHADATAPLAALAALGGLEIAMMVGAILQAASEDRIVLVDGFIAGSAVLVAHALAPAILDRCVFAHRSQEAGHRLLLQHLQAAPLLDLGLRLGEGSGAALAWPLLQSACLLLSEMASFDSAGVSDRAG